MHLYFQRTREKNPDPKETLDRNYHISWDLNIRTFPEDVKFRRDFFRIIYPPGQYVTNIRTSSALVNSRPAGQGRMIFLQKRAGFAVLRRSAERPIGGRQPD